MNIVRFKEIPKRINQMINEFEDSTLDFWFWGLIRDKSNSIIDFCAKKYTGEIKEDIFAFAKMIKIEIALLHGKINDFKLKRELNEIRRIIKIELSDIQIFFDRAAKSCRENFAYEN